MDLWTIMVALIAAGVVGGYVEKSTKSIRRDLWEIRARLDAIQQQLAARQPPSP